MSVSLLRPATPGDDHDLSRLLAENRYHRHLDWRNPVSLLGEHPFLVLERDGHITSAIACPPDPPGIAWLRLFATGFGKSRIRAWHELWNTARQNLPGGITAAAISLHDWLDDLLISSGFRKTQELVMLEGVSGEPSPPSGENQSGLRSMNDGDLMAVEDVDGAAFPALWRISKEDLQRAYAQAHYATVYEDGKRLLGYQVSTRTTLGLHLARLAVHPQSQGKGVGHYLLQDLFRQASTQGIHHFTVNTQGDNAVSLSLYQKLGFKLTGESFPVYTLALPG